MPERRRESNCILEPTHVRGHMSRACNIDSLVDQLVCGNRLPSYEVCPTRGLPTHATSDARAAACPVKLKVGAA